MLVFENSSLFLSNLEFSNPRVKTTKQDHVKYLKKVPH